MADEEGGQQEAAPPLATDEPTRVPDPAEQPAAESAPEDATESAPAAEEGPAAAAAAVVEKGVLRLRGIPFAANEGNIFQFFEGAEGIQQPVEVYICRRNGRSTGECYVVLPTVEDAASARQQLDKRHIGHRYIEIFEASMPDLEAVRKILEESQPRGHCLRLRGLPFSATAADVIAFLEGVKLVEGTDAIVFTFTSDGRPSGEAYIEVADEAAAAAAMQKHKERMGPRYIEVFASTKHDLLQAAQQAQFQQGQAALRRRWAALNAGGGGGPMGGGMAGIPGLGGAVGSGPGGMRMMPQGPLGMGGSYGMGPYGGLGGGVAGAGAGLGVDSLAQAFEGVSLRGPQQQPGGAFMVAAPEMVQYGGVSVSSGVGGMPVPYYLVETGGATYGMPAPDRAPGAHQSLAQQQAAAAASQQQQQQQQGLLLAGYSQQGPVYVPAGYSQGGLVQPQQAPIGPAAAQQQQQQQYVLQQWPQTVDPPIWGYAGGGQATVIGQQVPGPFLAPLGGQGQAPGPQQHHQLPHRPG